MADPLKVYWDACVWIGLINGEVGKVDRCEHLIELAKKGDVQLWTSTITLAEVYKKKCENGIVALDEARDADFENYLLSNFVYLVQLDQAIGTLARRLLRKHPGLKKPNDALHLATAALNNVAELHTFDDDNLIPLDGKVARRDGEFLKICEPPVPTNVQIPLFEPILPADDMPPSEVGS